jgi:hypothetical protein
LKNFGITRKKLSLVPKERNTLEKIEMWAVYSMEVSRIANENLVFPDETGFNLISNRHMGIPLKIQKHT